ncbi:MAG: DUF4369 domain-containing protein [Bacteroidaceae bacterium]|nr:DUF4369 domain-containing protein [Bacteroidaceae bacterium]
MKSHFMMCLALLILALASCEHDDKVCRIHGTLPDDKYNDKCIYLIAMDKTIRDSVGIDSCFVKDRKFEITTTKHMMGILRMDYHFRFGLQDLLVVEEPGDVYVTIDSVSSAHGTPNNEVLQQWKQLTEVHNKQYRQLISFYQDAHFGGDSLRANTIKAYADSVHHAYKEQTRKMAAGLPEGPLKDFLGGMFPTSYKRQMPDGTIQEIPLD